MDPIAFEELIAELFRRRGLRTRTTARSGDEGVDVLAEDPDPITGGQIVIQAKRYRHTVPPTAVRDLDATMARCGANRGILVTTSGFGPGSRRWVEGLPLTLVDGPMLVALLREHGLAGRLGTDGTAGRGTGRRPAPAVPAAAAVPTVLAPGQNAVLPESALAALTVRFSSAGADADLTLLLLTAEGLVRSDGDFVFYHQRSAADGAVLLGEKAAADGRRTESAVLRPSRPPAGGPPGRRLRQHGRRHRADLRRTHRRGPAAAHRGRHRLVVPPAVRPRGVGDAGRRGLPAP
ncbi:restriction endonuclease [Kitasatospora arboriphila]